MSSSESAPLVSLATRIRDEIQETAERAAWLDDLRRFRHVVRHLYATQLDRERMSPLVEALPDLWREVRADLLAFADFLDDLARRRNPEPSA
ncbi:MAG TPA: hypothetical protein VFG86_08145 [Chloroflexota bacterium]|nr:hypothetical protein [Chloroflexota bacterium]